MVTPPSLLSGLTLIAALLILPRLTSASPSHAVQPTPITTPTTNHPQATPTPETLHHRRSANPGRPPEDRIEPLFTAHSPTVYRGLTYKPSWLNGKIPAKELEKIRHNRFQTKVINDAYDDYDGGPDYDDGYNVRRGVPARTATAVADVVKGEGDDYEEQNLIVLPWPTQTPDIESVLEKTFEPRPFITLITRGNGESASVNATGVAEAEAEATNRKTVV